MKNFTKTIFLIIALFSYVNISNANLPIATDSRIKTLIYSPTEIFRLKFHHNYQSYIEFPRNEKFKIITVGDSFAWQIKQVDNRLFIKPKQSGVSTNMTIITNKRPYHLEIVSSNAGITTIDAELAFVTKFYYPDKAYDFLQTVKVKKPLSKYEITPLNETLKSSEVSGGNQTISNQDQNILTQNNSKNSSKIGKGNIHNYSYSMTLGRNITESTQNITPVKIYDDGINTFFEFSILILMFNHLC